MGYFLLSLCKENTENIDLLRKTSLSILQGDLLNEMFAEFKTEDIKVENKNVHFQKAIPQPALP